MVDKCPKCGYRLEDSEDEDDARICLQLSTDELVGQIVADPEVLTVAAVRGGIIWGGHDSFEEAVTAEGIIELPSKLPATLRGMRHHAECCYIFSEDAVPRLSGMETGSGHFIYNVSKLLRKDDIREDLFGNPMMFIGDYQLCHTDSPLLSSALTDCSQYRSEPIVVGIFANLEEYEYGNKKAAVKLVFPKREEPPEVVLPPLEEVTKKGEERANAEKEARKSRGFLTRLYEWMARV